MRVRRAAECEPNPFTQLFAKKKESIERTRQVDGTRPVRPGTFLHHWIRRCQMPRTVTRPRVRGTRRIREAVGIFLGTKVVGIYLSEFR